MVRPLAVRPVLPGEVSEGEKRAYASRPIGRTNKEAPIGGTEQKARRRLRKRERERPVSSLPQAASPRRDRGRGARAQ